LVQQIFPIPHSPHIGPCPNTIYLVIIDTASPVRLIPTAWLDFDKPTVENIPEGAGVYRMHASMKIFYIGSSTQNIRQALLDCLSDPCISKASRFSYALTDSADKLKEQLLNEYRSKQNGEIPICMGEEQPD
jgi:hypothetical protein